MCTKNSVNQWAIAVPNCIAVSDAREGKSACIVAVVGGTSLAPLKALRTDFRQFEGGSTDVHTDFS
jgi:hypothetical protein